MIIRPVTKEDLPKLIWKGLETWKESIEKNFMERHEKKTLWFVAEDNGEPVGQILATMHNQFGKPYIWALRVREEYRNKGIGTQLIRRAEEALKAHGATIVTIDVDTWNKQALRLYERMGYKKVGGERREQWTRSYQGKIIEENVMLFDLEKSIA